MITFARLKYASFAHSAAYLILLTTWIAPGYEGIKHVFGYVHGIGWIGLSLACIVALRRRVIPLWLAVTVSVVGALGPFAGSIGFVVCERRRWRPRRLERGMV